MNNSGITNNYLKKIILEVNQYLNDDVNVPEEVFIRLIKELSVSNLLIPGVIEDDTLNFEVLISDDETTSVLPLFCDDDEFIQYYGSECEFNPIPNDIEFYVELVRDNAFNGLLINPSNAEFYMDDDLLFEIPLSFDMMIEDNFEGYSADKLLNIAQNVTNDSLVDFIRSEDDSFEAFMLELSKANLLNVIVSEKNLSDHADNGIISIDEAGEFTLCTTGDDESQFAIVFTSIDSIKQTLPEDSGLNYYYQLTLLDDLIKFILENDMDGIIINPGLDDCLITRRYLLEAYGGLSYNNPSFKNALDYAFSL